MRVYVNGPLVAIGHESVTVDNTAGGVALTDATMRQAVTTNDPVSINRHAAEALITNETAQIRWTCDGTAPTTTVGHVLEGGDSLILQGHTNLQRFRAIRTGGTNGTLKVTYFRK